MAEPPLAGLKENKFWKGVFAVVGIMTTLVIYGVLQEKIMRVPYGENKEFFRYSLFIVFCNRITTSAVSAGALLASKKALDPVAPVYKYCLVSVSNILTTTCQYELRVEQSDKAYCLNNLSDHKCLIQALKYVSFPVQTLAKCAKMIPVMDAFGGIKKDVVLVTVDELLAANRTIIHYYFASKPSLEGLVLQGHLLLAIEFVSRHNDCFFDIALLSTVATASQFFISYTIRTFGALTFATVMTTRQVIVFGSLYVKSFMRSIPQKPGPQEHTQAGASSPLKGSP
ncbi:hypothetical protein HHK36_010928 [Tetracentron sinense]|uniref:Uncharacterized protein n=1 Tax=Tetracentron sinense TaxID=13715 RepID=A0A834ZAE9_TETSI|nr:hypothetical protein HHK36_010928 [Tetracentron sinense]